MSTDEVLLVVASIFFLAAVFAVYLGLRTGKKKSVSSTPEEKKDDAPDSSSEKARAPKKEKKVRTWPGKLGLWFGIFAGITFWVVVGAWALKAINGPAPAPIVAVTPIEREWVMEIVGLNRRRLISPKKVRVIQLSEQGVEWKYQALDAWCVFSHELGSNPQEVGSWIWGGYEKGYVQVDGWQNPSLYLSKWEKGITGKFWDHGESKDKPAQYTFILYPTEKPWKE